MEKNLICRDGASFHQFKRDSDTEDFPNAFSRHLDSENGKTYFWKPGKFHVVTDADLAKKVLKNSVFSADRSLFFQSRMPNLDLSLIKDFFSVVQKMMVMSDDEDHRRRRGAANMGFEDHVLDRFKQKVDSTVAELLQDKLEGEQIDFSLIANTLPSTVLADLFSVPQADREEFVELSLKMTAFFGGGTGYENADGIRVNEAAVKLRSYFSELIQQRRSCLGEDYVSSLLKMQSRFELTDDEVISQAIMMLVAGQVTTSDQMCNNMYLLAKNPQIQRELHSHPDLIPRALEEFTRFDPAVTFIFRVSKEDAMIGDQPINQGDTIFISTHAINRNGVVDGYKIDIHRKSVQAHFSYGHGPHFCIGARLARMEMSLLFEKILSQCPYLEVVTAERDHYSLSFSGFKKLILQRRN